MCLFMTRHFQHWILTLTMSKLNFIKFRCFCFVAMTDSRWIFLRSPPHFRV